jgi:hypothetical protein
MDDQTKEKKESRASKTYRLLWAVLLARVFSIDVLRCSKCGGQRVLVAFIQDPPVIEKILSHLSLSTKPPQLCPRSFSTPARNGLRVHNPFSTQRQVF